MSPISPTDRRRTKIIATLGPASRSAENIKRLIKAGVNVFRLNFSHGSYEEHGESLQRIKAASKELETPVAILQDLCGPKIRISKIEGDYATVGDNVTVTLKFAVGQFTTPETIFVESVNPAEAMEIGHHALLADGIIEIEAVSKTKDTVTCKVIKGGRLRSRVGIAFPDSAINLPATTEKDMKDLAWGIENKVDYVAISFVQTPEDVTRVKNVIAENKSHQKIIAKIERKIAVKNFAEILDVTDAVMVARGDLGLEYHLEELPLIQRWLVEQSNARGTPVIVATQMLSSMVTAIRPTRAEVSDVAAAVMSGADAVMLSEETTIGDHPVVCVEYLHRIAVEAEKSFAFEEFRLRLRTADRAAIPDAVAYAACSAGYKVGASALIVNTETGTSARLTAKYRPQQFLYGVSPSNETLQRMCLYWGVTPILVTPAKSHEDEVGTALKTIQKREHIPSGSKAVITGGQAARNAGSTSIIEIREFR